MTARHQRVSCTGKMELSSGVRSVWSWDGKCGCRADGGNEKGA